MTTVYNPRIVTSDMQRASLRVGRVRNSLLIVLVLLLAAFSLATDWTTPEAQLAGKIAAVTGPGAVALDISNRSSLGQADADAVMRGLRGQLEAVGLRFVAAEQAAATIKVTLSENLQSYVWVAEIHQAAGESSVVMVSIARAGGMAATPEGASIAIHKGLLWTQAERILDVAVMDGNPTHMAVLDANQVAVYRLQGSQWQPEEFLPIVHLRPWPRDLRGRLVLRKDHLLDAYLPGIFCRTATSSPIALNCSESDDPWPLGTEQSNLNAFFAPVRNYFTGALAPGIGKQKAAPAFYSAAALPRENYWLWLFAGVDGQVHLLDGITDQEKKTAWGSDIASVHNPCGTDWAILTDSPGDGQNENLRAFDVADRELLAAGQPMQFSGPISALWAEANGNNAIAVARNRETGDYEAFRLSFTCGQ